MAGAFVGSVRLREQHVHVCNAWDCDVCAQVVLWAAVPCSCVLLAWVMLGWAALPGGRARCIVGTRIARVGAGRRSGLGAAQSAERLLGLLGCEKVVSPKRV
eukprot:6341416-Prymnesium_polylepis.1